MAVWLDDHTSPNNHNNNNNNNDVSFRPRCSRWKYGNNQCFLFSTTRPRLATLEAHIFRVSKHMKIPCHVPKFLRVQPGKKTSHFSVSCTWHVPCHVLHKCTVWIHILNMSNVNKGNLTRTQKPAPGWPGHMHRTYPAHGFPFFWVAYRTVQNDPEATRTHM